MDVTFDEVKPIIPFSDPHLQREKKLEEDEGVLQFLHLLLDSLPSPKAIQPIQDPLTVEQTKATESVQVQPLLD